MLQLMDSRAEQSNMEKNKKNLLSHLMDSFIRKAMGTFLNCD